MKTAPQTIILAFSLFLLLPTCAWAYYSPEQGRWISRDPAGEREPNVYTLDSGDPLGNFDFLGLYTVNSEGYAFRDPLWGSAGWQSGSGFSSSAAAHFDGWASPWRTSICNSGSLHETTDKLDYPSERTSYVRAFIRDKCPRKFRVTCKVKLTAFVWGRQNEGVAAYSAKGTILNEPIVKSDTFSLPFSFDGKSAWISYFQKTVTKQIEAQFYQLYYVYMPIALQVRDHFRGGFMEHGEADCSIE